MYVCLSTCCMSICAPEVTSDALELGSQMVVSGHVGARLRWLFTAKPSLQHPRD